MMSASALLTLGITMASIWWVVYVRVYSVWLQRTELGKAGHRKIRAAILPSTLDPSKLKISLPPPTKQSPDRPWSSP